MSLPPVENLYVSAIGVKPVNVDWSEGYAETWRSYEAPSCPECDAYAVWDSEENEWRCPKTGCDLNLAETEIEDEDATGPVMNYAYPLEDLGRFEDGNEAASAIPDLPLCIVGEEGRDDATPWGGEWALALTGGGMDLSWEICEAFMRLGFLPPTHFADLPRFAGRPSGEVDTWIIHGCLRSFEVAEFQAVSAIKRLNDMLNAPVPS